MAHEPKNILIVSDNDYWRRKAQDLKVLCLKEGTAYVDVHRSQPRNYEGFSGVRVYDPDEAQRLAETYDVVLSLHCQQIFHKNLVEGTLCVNLHPGLLPGGRGWRPYVYDLAYQRPSGASLHIMTTKVDHGPILVISVVEPTETDTCDTLYARIRKEETRLLTEWFPVLVHYPNYRIRYLASPAPETPCSDPYRKADYEAFCNLEPDLATMTPRDLLYRLAALTFEEQCHAYLQDKSGNKYHVGIMFRKDS